MKDIKQQIQEAQWVLYRINTKVNKDKQKKRKKKKKKNHRHIIAKLLKINNKEKILNVFKKNNHTVWSIKGSNRN